jgi:hypothetical protein
MKGSQGASTCNPYSADRRRNARGRLWSELEDNWTSDDDYDAGAVLHDGRVTNPLGRPRNCL